MLTQQDNELMCRIGPGTPMGALVRQYWIPALMSSELPEADGAPLRLRLLGEDLVTYRTTSGAIGVMQNACPHRGASMFFGRNEEEGLRCVYHGWKFDVTGACVDMPNEPAESNFKHKIKATAYPATERNGVMWVSMGPLATPPQLPDIEANMMPEGEWSVNTTLRECNWVQALEGDIDTSHLGFLHLGGVKAEDTVPGTFDFYTVKDPAPRYEVVNTDFGTMYGAYRPAGPGQLYWRLAHFLFPFWTLIPTGTLGLQIFARAWVPVDDEHTMVWSMVQANRFARQGQDGRERRGAPPVGSTGRFEYLPQGSGWLGRWRATQNKQNDYLIDRAVQKTGSYTGIDGITCQDQAITEGMGGILDRSAEHLGTSDAMIIRTRQRLIRAAAAMRDHGTIPPGADNPAVFRQRSGGIFLPEGADWQSATSAYREAFAEHPELQQA